MSAASFAGSSRSNKTGVSGRRTKPGESKRPTEESLPSSLRVLALGMLWLALTTAVWSPFILAVSVLAGLAALACELQLAQSRGRGVRQLGTRLISAGAWTIAIALSGFYVACVALVAWAT